MRAATFSFVITRLAFVARARRRQYRIQLVIHYPQTVMGTLTVRLDARTASTVDRVAAQTGKTKSEIVREAIREFVEKVGKKNQSERPYDQVVDLIGSCDSGGLQLSTRTGEKFTEMLLRERDERRGADRRRPARRVDR